MRILETTCSARGRQCEWWSSLLRGFLGHVSKCRLVGDLHEDMLDEYLDFCERALLPPESNRQNGKCGIYDICVSGLISLSDRDLPAKYFTLTRKDAGCRVLGESAHIELRSQSSDGHAGGMLNCAKSYSLYDSRDVAGSLPEELELIVGRYARWIGVEVDYLCVVIESFERRIGRWCEERRRRQRDG
jgi:RNA polymerase I-specific transcription initiation factor RRN7